MDEDWIICGVTVDEDRRVHPVNIDLEDRGMDAEPAVCALPELNLHRCKVID